jgi:hypothetical protein
VSDQSGLDEVLKELRGQPVVALLGFADTWDQGSTLRLYPDVAYQRWMDIPTADIKAKAPYDDLGRTVVWVDRDSLNQPLFIDDTIELLDGRYAGAPISTWALIPDSRYVAAQLLELVAPYAEGEEEGYQ